MRTHPAIDRFTVPVPVPRRTTVGFVSFRLGGADGVSVAADGWADAFERLGCEVVRVAGSGPVDRVVPGLSALDRSVVPSAGELDAALAGLDVVVVENMFSLPLHVPASRALASALQERATIVRHFDLPWHRRQFAGITEMPFSSPAWLHTVATKATRGELWTRGIASELIYPALPAPQDPAPDPEATRRSLGLPANARLFLHPVRAIARKGLDVALHIAEARRATYWLTGAAEDGFAPELHRLLARAQTPTIWCPMDEVGVNAAYAAADLVLYPSTREGFGLPPVEAALRRRPVVVGNYPAAEELRRLGFRWLRPDEPNMGCDDETLDHNQTVAQQNFSTAAVSRSLAAALDHLGVPSPPRSRASTTLISHRLRLRTVRWDHRSCIQEMTHP